MLAVSQNFKDATESETRNIKARITMKGVTYTNSDIFNVEYNGGSITGETFNIGSTFSNNIKVTFSSIIEELLLDDQVKLEFGVVLSDSTIEYVKMGTFFITSYDPQRNDFKTVIEASDKMIQLNSIYKSKLTYPARIKDVAIEIANLAGVQVNTTSFSRINTSLISQIQGYTFRQAIGLIAQFECGYALFDRNGQLDIRMLSDPEYAVNTSSYFSKGLTKNEVKYTIGGISCTVVQKKDDSIETITLQSGSTSGAQVSLENNVMTQTLLDAMYQKIRTVNYFPFTLNWRGNPALEAGDWITVVDIRDNRFKVPNLNYKLSFSGGLKAVSSANTQTVSASSYQYKGNLQQQIYELSGRIGAAGNHVYDGLEEPVKPKEKDLWFKPNGPDTQIWIYQNGEWVFQVSTATNPEIAEAIEQAQTEATEAKTAAQDAVDKANASVTAVQANTQLINDVNAIANNAKSQAQTAATNAQTALTNANTANDNANKAISDVGILSEDVLALDTIANQAKSDADTALINANKGITDAKTALDKAIGVDTRVTTEITNVNNTLATKANSTTVDALSNTVSSQGTAISQNATDIKLKADSTVVNAIKGTVDNQGTLISQNSKNIALKANQSSVDTLTGRVSANETAIDVTAQGVSTLVTKTDGTNTSLSQFKQDYEGFKGTVYTKGQTDTKVSTVQQSVDNFKTTVSNTYSSKAETDSKVTAVQANVDKIGNYTAYANNADGTNGFTTVYPNLNLGDNTKTFVGADGEASNLRGSIRIDPATQKTQDGDINYLTFKPTRDGYDWFRFFLIPDTATPNMKKVAVKPNTKYTFSVLLKGTGQHTIYAYQNWTVQNTPWSLQINLTNDWKLYTFTVTSSNVIPDRNVQFFIRSDNGTEINLKYPKVDLGSTATPYMPSEKELTSNDIPKYVGSSVRQSENPKDFSWKPYSGFNSYKIIEATTSIEQNSKEIALKANKTDVNTLTGRVTSAEGSISTMAGQIVLKANQVDVNTTNGKVSSLESSFTIQSDQISALNTKTDGTNTSLSQFKQDYDGFKSTVYSKTQTDTKISTVQANVDKLGTNIAYAWSQDGKDKFTRVKPNENIITQSPSGASLTSTTTNNTDFFDLFKISQNYQTLSNWTTLNEVFTIGFSWESSTDLPDGASIGMFFAKAPWAWNFGSTNNVSGRKGSISKTGNNSGDLYNSIQTAMTIRLTNIPVGTIITITKVFVIAGNGQSFVPSLQDDYDNAVPRYIGRSLKDSNFPTDYKWELNPERKANQIQVTQLTQDLDGFKTTVSNTYLSKSDASGTYPTKTSVASQITQSATAVTSDVQSWTNNKLTAYSTTQQTATSITNAVASKADKTQITQLSNQITSVVTDVSAIQVGGQNLLLGTAAAKTSTITQTNSFTTTDPYNFSVSKLSAFNFEVDDYITLSFDWETTSTTGSVRAEINSTPYGFGNVISAKGTSGVTSNIKTITASEQRGRIEIVFKVVSSSKVSEATKLRLRFDDHQLNSTFTIKNAKLEKGNKATDWCIAPQEVANQSQITQLSTDINLRVSKGDVTSQINIEAGRTLIDTKQLLLNAGNVKFSGSAFIPNAMIQSITADKITAGTLNAANVNVINLNAANITTGTLSGANLSMNLNTGAVQFTKGYIEGGNGRIRLDLDNSYLKSFNAYNNNGFEIQDGVLKLYSSALNSSSVAAIETDILARDGGVNISAIGGVSLLSTKYKASIGVGTGGLANGNEISLQGNAYFWNDLMVLGKKNAIHVTRDGVRETPAYETAESYLGDIGRSYTRENYEVWVEIDPLFSDTVNTDIAYEVFLQAYDDARFWVEDFRSDKFLVKSDKPMARFAWEIKAKRRGYENDRLVIQEGVDNNLLDKVHDEGAF